MCMVQNGTCANCVRHDCETAFLLSNSFEAFGGLTAACAAVTGYVTDTTAAPPCLVLLNTCWTGSSPFWMQLHALSVTRGSTTMSLICSVTCTGCGFQREYATDWLCLSPAVITSSQHGASVPCSWPVLDRQGRSSATSTFQLSPITDHGANATSHDWRPFIPCDGSTGMEQSCS